MTVKTHITFKDFLNFNLKNSLPRMVIFTVLMVFVLILNFNNNDFNTQELYKSVIISTVLVFIFVAVRSYFRLKTVYHSNQKIQEEIIYTFTNEMVGTKGETFESDFLWSSVHRVKENKDWFLIYQSKTTMNMVPKKYFSENEITNLRKIIKNSGVKAKLLNQ